MTSDSRVALAAALLLTAAAPAVHARQAPPASARLSGIPRDVACAAASPLVRPFTPLKIVAGKEAVRSLFGTGEHVVLNAGTGQSLKAGDELYVRRVIQDEFTKPVAGSTPPVSIHTAGTLQIVETQADTSLAVVTYSCDGIMVGDYVEPFQPPALPASTAGAKPDFERPGHLILGDEKRQIGGAGEFMVFDRGSDHGVRPGQQLTIFRTTVAGGPIQTVGTAMVYVVHPQTSAVRIERSVDAVYVGDLVAIHR